jgi:rSAM/selenodomain-associated transferase 2
MISAVVPTLNEAGRIGALVATLREQVDEVIVSDGGSTDGTAAIAVQAGARVVTGNAGRGAQLDRGAAHASGDRLWFVHADSTLGAGSGAALRGAAGPWGCFRTRIASRDVRLLLTGWVMTQRAVRTGACTGDMGIWADRCFYERVGGFGPLPALEDLAFSDRARAIEPAEVLAPVLETSARRWTGQGVSRTMLRMWMIRLGYRVGIDPMRLSRGYQPVSI